MKNQATDQELLYRRKWGVFMHFLSDLYPAEPMTPQRWDAIVDAFDVARLARRLHQAQAGYFMITVGQNSGFFCAPNLVYDEIVRYPEAHTSRRDLVADLARELAGYDIPLFVYAPANPPFKDLRAVDAFGFEEVSQCDGRQAEFQRRWEAVLACWAQRWGHNIAGWWIDGCYLSGNRKLYCHADEPNFGSFARALRAGNSEALVAWNPGVADPELLTVAPEEDYTAGECQFPESVHILGRTEEQAQSHVLSYIGKWWGWREPRYNAATLIAASRNITERGGAITWDVPFEPNGDIPEEFFGLLCSLGEAYASSPGHADLPELAEARLMDNPLIASRVENGDAPGELTVQLRLRNTRRHEVANRLLISGDGLAATPETVPYRLAAGQECVIPVGCRIASGQTHGTLQIQNGGWRRQLEVRERFCCDLRHGGCLVREFEHGAGCIRLRTHNGCVSFELEAQDSLLRRGEPVYTGSCVEFFGSPVQATEEIGQLFAAPFDGNQLIRMVNYRHCPVPDSELTCEVTASGFRLNGSFQASALRWNDGGLFECALHVGSGSEFIYTSLFGSAYAAGSTRDYALLLL